jgi:sugar O-acyltransferase (sialic acid O-acetyltransferase NeuD family)
MKDIVIIGAGGFGKEVYWLIKDCINRGNVYNVHGFLDDNINVGTNVIEGINVIGDTNTLINDAYYICAIANNEDRKAIIHKLGKNKFITIVHPDAKVYSYDNIGVGSIICSNATLSVDSKIGDFCIIDWNVSIGHDTVVSSYSTIFPGAILSGHIFVDFEVTIGAGAVLLPKLKIGNNSYIGAGAVVTKNVDSNTTVIGNPAKIMVR